jgi:diacylglycerol kinase (ATP)
VKVEVVVNPNAAAFLRDRDLARRVSERVRGSGRTWVTPTLGDLEDAARAIVDAGAERVVLCGGDGSYMAGVSALDRVAAGRPLPELVLAPGGTVATIARNWGQRRGLLETLDRVLDGASLGRRERPTLRVAERDGTTRVGFIFGTGLVARFFDRYYATGAAGLFVAARIVARVFAGSFVASEYAKSVLDPLPCVLEVDGRELAPRAYSLIVSSVVRDLGLHMWVTHRAAEDPERPHLVASPLSPRALGPQAPRVLLGKRLRGGGCFDELVRTFSVRFPDGEGPYVLDGDLLRAKEVTVCAGPRIVVAT